MLHTASIPPIEGRFGSLPDGRSSNVVWHSHLAEQAQGAVAAGTRFLAVAGRLVRVAEGGQRPGDHQWPTGGLQDGQRLPAVAYRLLVVRLGQADAAQLVLHGWPAGLIRPVTSRCDTPFPARQRVAPRTTLRQRCYFKPVLADAAFGRDSDHAARTVAIRITIGDGSIGLEEITQ
jgi:hypothetical protein